MNYNFNISIDDNDDVLLEKKEYNSMTQLESMGYEKFKEIVRKEKLTKNDLNELGNYAEQYMFQHIIYTKNDLKKLIEHACSIDKYCNLNWIDTSQITDMSKLFYNIRFYGNISKWNVSKVKNMDKMFYGSGFDGDISDWNVSNVESMNKMFSYTPFNQNISKWNVSNVNEMNEMFYNSGFNQDISNWKIKKSVNTSCMFTNCYIKESYKPKFKRKIQ